ncbi:MAG: hypothetical protein WBO28_08320 [Flavobacteriales bacterium]
MLFAFDERKISADLNAHKARSGRPIMLLPFNDKGEVLPISIERFLALRTHSRSTLETIRRLMRSEPDEAMRFRCWHEIILARLTVTYGVEEWRAFMMHWALDVQGAAFGDDNDLSVQFIIIELRITGKNSTLSMNAAALKNRLAPELSLPGLVELAFDLEQERTRDELFRYFAPRAIVTAVSLFPIAKIPLLLGLVVQAITGFVQFMQFLEEADEDGDITEDELEEAKWQMAGIIPFNAVQLILLGRGISMVAFTFLIALRSGLAELADVMVRAGQAVKEGWSGYGEYDLDTALFLPDYVISADDEKATR